MIFCYILFSVENIMRPTRAPKLGGHKFVVLLTLHRKYRHYLQCDHKTHFLTVHKSVYSIHCIYVACMYILVVKSTACRLY